MPLLEIKNLKLEFGSGNAAVRAVFGKKELRTVEMRGTLGTRAMGEAVLQAMTQAAGK